MWRTDGRGTGKTRERGRGWSSKDRLDNTGGGRGKAEKKIHFCFEDVYRSKFSTMDRTWLCFVTWFCLQLEVRERERIGGKFP